MLSRWQLMHYVVDHALWASYSVKRIASKQNELAFVAEKHFFLCSRTPIFLRKPKSSFLILFAEEIFKQDVLHIVQKISRNVKGGGAHI